MNERLKNLLEYEIYLPFDRPSESAVLRVWSDLAFALGQDLDLDPLLERMAKNVPSLRWGLSRLRLKLSQGAPLGEAAVSPRARRLFPQAYWIYLREADRLRALPAMFTLMKERFARDRKLKHTIKALSTYPGMLAAIWTSAVGILSIFVIPTFIEITGETGRSASLYLDQMPHFMLIGLAAAMALFGSSYLLSMQVSFVSRVLEWVPLIGRARHYWYWNTFISALSRLVAAGVPVPDALASAGRVDGRSFVRRACARAAAKIEQGRKLSDCLRDENLFPPSLVWTVVQGEQQGNLEQGLKRLSERYAVMMNHHLERSLLASQRAVLILLAGGISLWAARFYLLIFSIPDASLKMMW